MNRIKRSVFIFIYTGLIVFILVIIEFGLRLAGAGTGTDPFIRHPYMKQFYVDNKDFRNKYYNRVVDLSRQPIKNVFAYDKKPGVLRGFVIGGSTAEGFPYYSNHSFSKILETALRWSGRYAGVEVLNMGFSAMSSYYDADAAIKLLKYKPDFIIIYSGHNEYYGTISATTGGGYFTKKLYLSLKELRIFQLLFNLIGDMTRPKDAENRTMMAEQFNDRPLPKNEKLDNQAAGDFMRNLESIVRLYTQRKIHVIVVDPACNLIDMPPFGGNTFFSNFIKDYYNSLLLGSPGESLDIYKERLFHPEYDKNSHILYLDAEAKEKLFHDDSVSNYILAKDYDTVPFRARSGLNQLLSNYSVKNEGPNPYYHYVPLQNILTAWYGHRVLGNNIFLDHVHYNWQGHVLIARILAEKLALVYKYNDSDKKKLVGFFENPGTVRQKLFFTPLHEIYGYYSILALSKQPPFSTMLIPFIPGPAVKNPFFRDTNLVKMPEEQAFNKIINDYIEKKDYTNALFYINSIMQVYQAEYRNFLALAQFQEMMKSEEALYNYITAYILSGRDREVYKQMETCFLNFGRPDLIETVRKKYGEPK